MTRGLYDYDNITSKIDSDASKQYVSDISLFTSWDPEDVTFITAARMTIRSDEVGTE